MNSIEISLKNWDLELYHQNKMNTETKLLVKFDCSDADSQELVDWAIEKMQQGFESPNLNELAWLYKPLNSEARELYLNSIEDLNLPISSRSDRLLLRVQILARKIARNEIDTNDGCSTLAEISRELDSPENLSVFELLAHEQYDHENIGITSENIKSDIIEAASKVAI